MRSKIKVGLDFDGVVAYNPFRIVRAPITFLKRNILGIRKLQFWYPRRYWQQIFWIILHESSVFPAKGVDLLRELVRQNKIEAHLVTARYSFLDNHLYNWLKKYKLRNLFKTINLNKTDEQPHIFKKKIIEKHKLDIFVEDNWDIVNYLSEKQKETLCHPERSRGISRECEIADRLRDSSRRKTPLGMTVRKPYTKIYWIYNILDRFVEYPYKFPYLEGALLDISSHINFSDSATRARW